LWNRLGSLAYGRIYQAPAASKNSSPSLVQVFGGGGMRCLWKILIFRLPRAASCRHTLHNQHVVHVHTDRGQKTDAMPHTPNGAAVKSEECTSPPRLRSLEFSLVCKSRMAKCARVKKKKKHKKRCSRTKIFVANARPQEG